MTLQLTDTEKTTFWRKIQVGNKNQCWLWLCSTNGVGYGKLKFRGKFWLAHRLAYILQVGDPGKSLLCHKCDNRLCVNPEHMFLGSYRDNTKDCMEKGRFAVGNRVVGSYLTEANVVAIRSLYIPRKFGRYKIGKLLNLSPVVGGVINGNNWAWVKG